MTTETKDFPTDAVLTVVTGMLMMKDIGGVYEVLNWMTGESVYTHQLPRIRREAQAVMITGNPALQLACDEAEQITPDNWRQWLEKWIDRYGPMIAVPHMTHDEHERIDPLSELAEKVLPYRIVVLEG